MFHKDVFAKFVTKPAATPGTPCRFPQSLMAAFLERSRPLLVFALAFTLSGLRAPLDAQPPQSCDQSWGHWRQPIAVQGLDLKSLKYPLSSQIIPSLGFATTDMSSAIDAAVGNFMNENGMPGATVAMTYNNQLIFAKSYGYADVDKALLAEPDSRLRIASVSKAITAMGILKLVHDQLAVVLPVGGQGWQLGYQPFNGHAFGAAIDGTLQSWIQPITVDELLHHAGGWAEDYENYDNLNAMMSLPSQNHSAPPDCLTLLRYVQARPMTSDDVAPGTTPKYSNIGFCALSEVIRELSGASSYSDYIQKNVFAPLGMNDTRLGSTQQSKRQDREVVYYPCGYSPVQGPPAFGVPCGYSSTGVLVKGGPSIEGKSLFSPHKMVSPAYGGGWPSYYLESLEGAGGFVSSAIDLAHFTGAIASGKLPNFQGGPLNPGWPEAFYTYSTKVPSYETFSCRDGYFGMGWDTVQPCAVAAPFVAYDNFNFIKGGGIPGTTSTVAATADGYSFAAIYNGDIGQTLSPIDVFWNSAYPAAVAHATTQPWNIDFSSQYSQDYSDWMTSTDFALYLEAQKSSGLYPSRLEGRTTKSTTDFEYRGRFGLQQATAGYTAPQFMYAQSCATVLSAIQSAPATTPLVSLQRFYDPSTAAYVYQAVWSAPIPQLPPVRQRLH
jgi:CubicO group peptidase (beta-lactamase class C family)